jgi:DNA-binding transcriptional regulator YdaS (Cro superfamily)
VLFALRVAVEHVDQALCVGLDFPLTPRYIIGCLYTDSPMTPIEKAVEVVGSQSELARQIGCSQVFVHHMVHGMRSIPPRFCRPIEHATNGAVTRYELRPDVFGERAA